MKEPEAAKALYKGLPAPSNSAKNRFGPMLPACMLPDTLPAVAAFFLRSCPLLLCSVILTWPFSAGRAQGTATASAPSPSVETVRPGVYRIGPVTLDKEARQVRFPAVVNQTSGPVEYLLVGSQGKTHESVLRTDAEPVQVHTAMLLLGVNALTAKGGPVPARTPPSAIDADYLATAKTPDGAAVTLSVRWQPAGGGAPVVRSGESLVDNTQKHAPMSEGDWIYNGSYFSNNRFEAQAEKSFVAVITDPSALLNNPRPGHENEEIWVAAANRLPPAGTAVEFVIQLPPAATH